MMEFTQEEQDFMDMKPIHIVTMFIKVVYQQMQNMIATDFDFENPEFKELDVTLDKLKALMQVYSDETAVTVNDVTNELTKFAERLASSNTLENQQKLEEAKYIALKILFMKP